jgi:hypothetical protein
MKPLPIFVVIAFLPITPPAIPAQDLGIRVNAPPDVKSEPAAVKWSYSADGGKTFSDAALAGVEQGKTQSIVARGVFSVAESARVAGILLRLNGERSVLCTGLRSELTNRHWHFPRGLESATVTLNGKPLGGPLAKTIYDWLPLDPGEHLLKGKNVLMIRGTFFNAADNEPAVFAPRMVIALPQVPQIKHGPVLGAIGKDYFSLTCKTTIPAKVTVEAQAFDGDTTDDGIIERATSERGYYHRLRVPLPKGGRRIAYQVTAKSAGGKTTTPVTSFKIPGGTDGTLRLVVIGNTRCHHLYTKDNGPKLAKAMLAEKPDLFVHAGQVSEFPWWEFYWQGAVFKSYGKLFSTVPTFLVPSVRDHAVLADEIFYKPSPDGRGLNWTQVIGDVRLIGLAGAYDWSAGGANARWLESVLKESKEEFILVFNHFPGYSSGRLSRPPLFKPMAQCRTVIHPLLAKYRATAIISASDFHYERSEPPKDIGVPQIVVGGGGAKVYRRSNRASANNPHRKVFANKHAFCVFDVSGGKCQLRVIDIDGEEIDRRSFDPQ